MIAVIKGDIIASRTLADPNKWLKPLKKLLSKWGRPRQDWELGWGDFFQIEIRNPEDALLKAFAIKAVVKSVASADVRMSIGIGEKTFSSDRISESNGPAFIWSGEKFDKLRKEKTNLAIQSPWIEFDQEINLYLKLAGIIMDNWSVSSAELVKIVLENPEATQELIGKSLGIMQNSVSGRWNRSKIDEILEVEKVYRSKLLQLTRP